jgi:two-component system cell cycle response regulator
MGAARDSPAPPTVPVTETDPDPAPAKPRYTVAFVGFSAFESSALASFFRLATGHAADYHRVDDTQAADFLVVDADHPQAFGSASAHRRLHDTIFVGAQAPAGAMSWLVRPIEPTRIVRELDALAAQRREGQAEHVDIFSAPQVDLLLSDLDQVHAGPAAAPARSSGGGNRRVLVVEDSGIARKFLSMRLHRLGYAVELARSGEEALPLLEAPPYAIVFLDITLGPQGSLDGLQLCQRIKRAAGHSGGGPKVVIVSGRSGETDRVRASLAGCDAYLNKPLGEADFLATLEQIDPEFAAD